MTQKKWSQIPIVEFLEEFQEILDEASIARLVILE
jgi:hypothetical protein